MVDNINLNKISPLLSSTERVKSVDRRQRHRQQTPFDSALPNKKKKKKKKKEGEEGIRSDAIDSTDSPQHPARAITGHQQKESESPAVQTKKIIDIRV